MFDRLADFVVARRRPILIAAGIVFLACAATIPFLQFDFTYQKLFESGGDAQEYAQKFGDRFGHDDNILTVVLEGDELFAPEVLGPKRDLTYQLERHDAVVTAHSVATLSLPRPDSVSAEPHLGHPYDVDQQTDFLRGPAVEPREARQLAEDARHEPLITDRFVNPEGTKSIIAVWIDPDIRAAMDLDDLSGEVAGIVDRYEFPDDVSVDIQGIPELRATIMDQLRTEQYTTLPLVAVIFIGLLWLLFRRPAAIVLPMASLAFALAATVALLVATDSSINLISNILLHLIFIIGIADSIHMLTRQAEEVGLGRTHDDAVKEMIRHTGAACLLTTGTTAVGFLSLLSADAVILRSFGWQAGAGVMFAYLGTIFVLSAGLTYMRPVVRQSTGPSRDKPALVERSLLAIGDRVLARPWTTVAVSVLILGAVIAQSRHVTVDTEIMDILVEDHPTRVATEQLEDELGGVIPLEISLEADEKQTFRHPSYFRKVDELQQYALEHEHVLAAESYVDYLQTARVAVVGDRDEREVLPESRDEIEQLLMLTADAPDADDELSNFVTDDFRKARIATRVASVGGNAHIELSERLETRGRDIFDGTDVSVRISGLAHLSAVSQEAFVRDLGVSLCIAIVVIFGMMTVVFRSWKIGIISLLPNTIPLLVALGFMGWAGINLDSSTIIMFAIGLGLAVDDSIHFFARFAEERNRCDDLREAIRQTYQGAGRAILLTSILLVVGMAVLQTSQFVPTLEFSMLLGIIVAGAVVADLLLLPAVMYLIYSKFPGDGTQTAPFQSGGHGPPPPDGTTASAEERPTRE